MWGQFVYEGGTTAYDALWYRGPDGLEVIAYEGMQAPDMPAGVTYRWMFEHLAECGWIGITAFVQGPGIVPGFNDLVNFAGPPGDIGKVLQGVDPAPGLEPGTIIDASRGTGLTAFLSDNATMRVMAWLAGPGIDESNDQAIWIGPPEDLQLIWRKGMEAPGTGGARFAWADQVVFNDDRQIAFRGGLVREPGIDYTNDSGVWTGGVIGLELLGRERSPAPGTSDLFSVLSGVSINDQGDVAFGGAVDPRGGPLDYEPGLWLHTDDETVLLARAGDMMREIGRDVQLVSVSSPYVASDRSIFYRTKYEGPGIDSCNAWAMWYGPFGQAQEDLRDTEHAPTFPSDVRWSAVGGAPSLTAMNDLGDIVIGAEVVGPDISDADKVVVWFRDSLRASWFPLIRSGTQIRKRIVLIPDRTDLLSSYWNKTSGSDGWLQSFNDAGQLAIRLEFADGSHGVFVARFEWPGDSDGDRDLDLLDLASLQRCYGKLVPGAQSECRPFDLDDNGFVGLSDYSLFVDGMTGPWIAGKEVVTMGE